MRKSDFSEKMSGKLVRTTAGNLSFMPAPLPPGIEWDTKMVSALTEARSAVARLSEAALDGTVGPAIISGIIRLFTNMEAQSSSSVEGIETTQHELFAFQNSPGNSEATENTREVNNYLEALNLGVDNRNRTDGLPISKRLILELHRQLLSGAVRGRDKSPGEFRTGQNFIGSRGDTEETARFVPPPALEMNVCLNQLEEYLHSDDEFDPLLRIAFIHYQFEAIHPFKDGNGRIGRLLIALLLLEYGLMEKPLLYLSTFFDEHKEEYCERLIRVSQHGEWNEWLQFFLRGVLMQAEDARLRFVRLRELFQQYHQILQTENAPGRTFAVVDYVFYNPVLSVRHIEKVLDQTYDNANRSVAQLVELGIIRPVDNRKRNRVFEAHQVMEIIELG